MKMRSTVSTMRHTNELSYCLINVERSLNLWELSNQKMIKIYLLFAVITRLYAIKSKQLFRLGLQEQCGKALHDSIQASLSPATSNPSIRMKKLRFLSKAYMQKCAIYSQQNLHEEAISYAETSAKLAHMLLADLTKICESSVEKVEKYRSMHQRNHSFIEDIESANATLLDLCALKITPILHELQKSLVPEANSNLKYLSLIHI